MTTEDLAKLTPEEKRIRIAELCGWSVITSDGVGRPPWSDRCGADDRELPDYLNDLNAAITLTELLAERGWRCELGNRLDKTWECEFWKAATSETRDKDRGTRRGEPGEVEIHYGSADTLAAAICDAFLLTLG